jgi:general secretion pathway protein D
VGGFASESVNYVDVGLTLNVEPTVYLNSEVGIRISLEVSNLVDTIKTSSGTTAYRIGTRSASTMLQLKDGENQVLAGLIKAEDRSSGSHLPGVGDVPLLGRLFGSKQDSRDKTEVVLSITPHLIRNIQRPAASTSEFSAGTESSFRRRPDTAVRAVAVLPGAAARPAAGQPAALPAPQPGAQQGVQQGVQPGQVPAQQAVQQPVQQPGAMVPATSVSAGGPPPSAAPSVPATSLPPTPGVQVNPLPAPAISPLPAAPASAPTVATPANPTAAGTR